METNERNWNNEEMDNTQMWSSQPEDTDFESLENDNNEYNAADEGEFDADESLDADTDADSNSETETWDSSESFEDEEDL